MENVNEEFPGTMTPALVAASGSSARFAKAVAQHSFLDRSPCRGPNLGRGAQYSWTPLHFAGRVSAGVFRNAQSGGLLGTYW